MRVEQIAYKRGFRVDISGNVYNSESDKVKCSVNDQGYKLFGTGLKAKNEYYIVYVHRLQAFIKYGSNMYNFEVVRHKDGNKLNNSIANILTGSYVDNYHDIPIVERKKINYAMAKTKSQYSDKQIIEMFKLRREGYYYYEIAKIFNCTKGWVYAIINQKTYYTKRILI